MVCEPVQATNQCENHAPSGQARLFVFEQTGKSYHSRYHGKLRIRQKTIPRNFIVICPHSSLGVKVSCAG